MCFTLKVVEGPQSKESVLVSALSPPSPSFLSLQASSRRVSWLHQDPA